ncbi:MAG: hypothetical protein NTZ05_06365, partial [Chloroflexi bacterium]|nr:hypothetical protein [Chloroflexota bacterium]
LAETLTHYNYDSWGQFIAKQRAYAEREGRTLRTSGAPLKPKWLITQPLREFQWRFFRLEGYKEGRMGLMLSLLMAWYRYRVQVEARKTE